MVSRSDTWRGNHGVVAPSSTSVDRVACRSSSRSRACSRSDGSDSKSMKNSNPPVVMGRLSMRVMFTSNFQKYLREREASESVGS